GGAVGHAHAAVADACVVEQAGITQRVFAGGHGELRHAAHRAGLLARPRRRREVVHRAAEAAVQRVEVIPLVHAAHGVAMLAEARGDGGPVVAQRRDAAHAGDDDAFHRVWVPGLVLLLELEKRFVPLTGRELLSLCVAKEKVTTTAAGAAANGAAGPQGGGQDARRKEKGHPAEALSVRPWTEST